jgi:hypothetical protein
VLLVPAAEAARADPVKKKGYATTHDPSNAFPNASSISLITILLLSLVRSLLFRRKTVATDEGPQVYTPPTVVVKEVTRGADGAVRGLQKSELVTMVEGGQPSTRFFALRCKFQLQNRCGRQAERGVCR